jgi:tetratricopeptide (TPR) repeat protein
LLKSSNHGQETFVQNNQFGWRFFGPRAARQPHATSIPREKPPGTIRIFVFGESAAFGDPQPRFGVPRMLEAMLELRHPDKKFEVINAASDPRLDAVYQNFGQNLNDIIAAGKSSGAKIVLSTVAVNLKDCAPFASLHRPDLSEARLNDWQRLHDAGTNAQAGGNIKQAASDFDQAERIDERFAELRFRRGQCVLALNGVTEAQKEFAAARDLDALRFRCDSRLNDIIRRQATDGITLVDGEVALADASAHGIPGDELFYEHVHLTFQGNYALAREIAEKVEQTLTLPESAAWPDTAQCAQRLGCTPRDTQLALAILLGRLRDVPFTFQANHDQEMSRLTQTARGLPPANSVASLRGAQAAAEAALARWPDDAELWEQLAEIKQSLGDYAGAFDAAHNSLDRVPSNAGGWLLYGILLALGEKYEDALTAFKQVLALDPQAAWARNNLALCLEKIGRPGEAIGEFKRTLAMNPDYGTGWLALGQLYEKMGRTNNAEPCDNKALTNRVNQPDDLAALARFCFNHRWLEQAATNFSAAIELSPFDFGLRLDAGRTFAALGRHDEAVRQYQEAVELDPDQAQPHMQLAVELGRLRKPALAEKEFRETLRLNPALMQAEVNLGIALYEQGKLEEARKQFEDVLQRNPNDPTALRYVQQLRNRTPLPAVR